MRQAAKRPPSHAKRSRERVAHGDAPGDLVGRSARRLRRRLHAEHPEILGIILFLRLGYVVGASGLQAALLIIILANAISVLTSFSIAAIATNIRVKGGGDHYLISRTLGLGFGGAIGLVLFFAQSISVGFYAVGFGEAVAALTGLEGFAAQAIVVAPVTRENIHLVREEGWV